MYLVTAEQMRKLEERAMSDSGLPSLVLMENAARAVADAAIRMDRPDRPMKRWAVLAGKGNNGGDGIAAARHLTEAGCSCEIILAVPPEQLGADAALQLKAARSFGIPVQVFSPGATPWHRYDGIIDALLGTGTAGAPREPYASMIREANGSGLPIVAVDIPSGLDADSGKVYEPCIRAVQTVTFACSKVGLALYPGKEAAGTVTTAPIGIPEQLAEAAAAALARRGVEATVEMVELRDIAHDMIDHLLEGQTSPELRKAIDEVTRADGIIAVTPIFSASYNGLFKNFFDVLDPDSLAGKPVLIGATAGTPRHSLALEHAIRPLFTFLRAVVAPTAVFAASEDWDEDRQPMISERIRRAADEFAHFVFARASAEAAVTRN